MISIRPTVRLRLALIFGAMFLLLGVLLLAITYVLFRESLAALPSITAQDVLREQAALPRRGELLQLVGEIRREERTSALRAAAEQSLVALLACGLVAIVLGWLVAGQSLRPVRRIIDHVRRASAPSLDQPVRLQGPDNELKELADTYDAMLARLHASFESRRRFAADVSHELRTPLTIIQAEAELLVAAPDASDRGTTGATILAATKRTGRLIDGLLALSRAESTAIERQPVDMAELTGEVVGALAREADARRITIDLRLDDATVPGDRVLLEQLVANLAGNAIRHNVDGGWMRIEVGRGDEGSQARLHVTNDGAVVSGDPETLFVPFHRGTGAVPGAGLGLAIARAVVTAHNGTITARPRPEGGLDVTVRLTSAT